MRRQIRRRAAKGNILPKKMVASAKKNDHLINNAEHNNSNKSQQSRILKSLEISGAKGLTTEEIRAQLSIMHPGGRVFELRHMGHRILSRRENNGMARYVLCASKNLGVHNGQV